MYQVCVANHSRDIEFWLIQPFFAKIATLGTCYKKSADDKLMWLYLAIEIKRKQTATTNSLLGTTMCQTKLTEQVFQ